MSNIYIPFEKSLTKQDQDYVKVYGLVTSDVVDLEGQIVDAKSARVALQDWFDNHANIRQMHSSTNLPAGKAVEMEFRNNKAYITAKIVEPTAMRLVKEEVYKGFSIGICDGDIEFDGTAPRGRIIVNLVDEVSLVDYPANQEANKKLTLVKVFNKGGDMSDVDKKVTEGIEDLQKDILDIKQEQVKDDKDPANKEVEEALEKVEQAVDDLAKAQAKDNATDNKAQKGIAKDTKTATKGKTKKCEGAKCINPKCKVHGKLFKKLHDVSCPIVSVKKNLSKSDIKTITNDLQASVSKIDPTVIVDKALLLMAATNVKSISLPDITKAKSAVQGYGDLTSSLQRINTSLTDETGRSVGTVKPEMTSNDLLDKNDNANIPIQKARQYYTNVDKDKASSSLSVLHDYICATHPDICSMPISPDGNVGTTPDLVSQSSAGNVPTIPIERQGTIIDQRLTKSLNSIASILNQSKDANIVNDKTLKELNKQRKLNKSLKTDIAKLTKEYKKMAGSPDTSNSPFKVMQFKQREPLNLKKINKRKKIEELFKDAKHSNKTISTKAIEDLRKLGVSADKIAKGII